jgi:RND family efflux transporter MFP subunit
MSTFIRKRRWLVALLLVPVAAGVFWLLGGADRFRDHREAWPDDAPAGEHDAARVSVTVAPVTFRAVQRSVEAVGTLYGFEEVTLSAKVEGRVRRVLRDVADRVRPGERLAEIDPTDYELSEKQADRALLVELARLGLKEPPGPDFDVHKVVPVQQAAVRMDNARSRMERAQTLAARKAIALEELADKITDFRVAQTEHDSQILVAQTGLATIQMKQEALAMARQQFKDTVIYAPLPTIPVPGVREVNYAISHRYVAEGTHAKAGAEVFRLVIDQALKLRVAVPERYSGEVRVGQPAKIYTAARPTPSDGVVARLNPAVDPVSRTFEVEIHVANADGGLKPGGFAKAFILTRLDQEAATVPLEAVIRFAGITKIFLEENGRARIVPVTLGVQKTDWVEIASPPLPRGGRVVTSGHSALADGTAVVVRDASSRNPR